MFKDWRSEYFKDQLFQKEIFNSKSVQTLAASYFTISLYNYF